jgi:hypothetical protein
MARAPLPWSDAQFQASAESSRSIVRTELDLRSERAAPEAQAVVEADHLRLRREAIKVLAPAPSGELPPVGGIGTLRIRARRPAGIVARLLNEVLEMRGRDRHPGRLNGRRLWSRRAPGRRFRGFGWPFRESLSDKYGTCENGGLSPVTFG